MEYISNFERELGLTQEPYGLALNELSQAQETGHDVGELRECFSTLEPSDDAALLEIYEEVLGLPDPEAWPHFEGSALDEITAELPAAVTVPAPSGDSLGNKLAGAWAGRIAGNMLGKPVELGWSRAKIKAYLLDQGAYPISDYIPLDDESKAAERGFFVHGTDFSVEGLTRGRVDGGVRDDDVDYTILGLHLLETYGADFTSRDVAFEWLSRFPVYRVYTAERATYQNLIREVPFEQVGSFRNPMREWIGAQIRADIFGYVSPGDPRRAALLAYKDASLSHRANGIYGAMWAAALIATAFTASSPEQSIELSLQQVPATSRLAVEVAAVLDDYRNGLSWEESLDKLDRRYASMSWVHTLNNTGALTAAILWGAGDYTATIGHAVQAGLDTDSIGATAGSWAGAFLGYSNLPEHWIAPLKDRTTSAVFGYGDVRIGALAERTIALVRASPSPTSTLGTGQEP